MRQLRFTEPALRDVDTIVDESEDRFGVEAAEAYRALLTAAFLDLRTNPARPTVKGRPSVPKDLRFYHVRLSRGRSPVRVGRPRHIVVFRDDGEIVEIVRVLHDAMDIVARLGDEG